MSNEDKIMYGGLAVILVGSYFYWKSRKPKGIDEETKNVIRQDCVNAANEQAKKTPISEEGIAQFVEDCTKQLIEEEVI